MAKNINSAEKSADKTTKEKGKSLQDVAMPVIDRLMQAAGALFFIATSYGYVSEWLKTHQGHEDLSVAGGILVVGVALYLFTRRKR